MKISPLHRYFPQSLRGEKTGATFTVRRKQQKFQCRGTGCGDELGFE
jgi:hypothetical protein